FSPCTSPKTYDNVALGWHAFTARAIDPAGNYDLNGRSWYWTVQPPQSNGTHITSGPPSPTSSTSAAFTFAANANSATFECRLDGAAWASCTSGVEYDSLAAGSHRFEVRATIDGSTDDPPIAWSWTIDRQPPD